MLLRALDEILNPDEPLPLLLVPAISEDRFMAFSMETGSVSWPNPPRNWARSPSVTSLSSREGVPGVEESGVKTSGVRSPDSAAT